MNDESVVQLPTIAPDMIRPILERARRADNPTGEQHGSDKPVLLLGRPGLGKTNIGRQFAEDNGMIYIPIYLSYCTYNDVKGFGVPNHEKERMVWYIDEAFPDPDSDKSYLIFWDELFNATSSVIKVAQQAVLEREIGNGYKCPRKTMMVAAANGLKHHCQASRAPASVMDRFAVYAVEPAIKATLDWLAENAQTEYVHSFLQAHNESLYCDNMDKWDGEQAQSSSRSYAKLDNYLASYRGVSEMLPAENTRQFKADVSARIGAKAGQEFHTYMLLYATCGDVGKLLADARNCNLTSIINRPDMRYIVASNLVALAEKDNLSDVLLLSHRLTDPDINRPNDLESMESMVGNRLRRSRKDLASVRALIEWQLKHKSELLK